MELKVRAENVYLLGLQSTFFTCIEKPEWVYCKSILAFVLTFCSKTSKKYNPTDHHWLSLL